MRGSCGIAAPDLPSGRLNKNLHKCPEAALHISATIQYLLMRQWRQEENVEFEQFDRRLRIILSYR
jgi:hypothetical protein